MAERRPSHPFPPRLCMLFFLHYSSLCCSRRREEDELAELIWDDGPVMLSQSSKHRRSSVPAAAVPFVAQEKDRPASFDKKKLARFGDVDPKPSSRKKSVHVHDDDVLVPWANLALLTTETMQNDDYSNESAGLDQKIFRPLHKNTMTADKSSGSTGPLRGRNSSPRCRNSLRTDLARTIASTVNTRLQGHTVPDRMAPKASNGGLGTVENFSHFLRPSSVLANARSHERVSAIAGTNVGSSTKPCQEEGAVFMEQAPPALSQADPLKEEEDDKNMPIASSSVGSIAVSRHEGKAAAEAIATSSSSSSSENSDDAEPNRHRYREKRRISVGEDSGYHHSKRRRERRIDEKMRALQELIPNCNYKADKASILEEAIKFLKILQMQLQMMSMARGLYTMQHIHLPTMGYRLGFGLGGFDMSSPLACPAVPIPLQFSPASLSGWMTQALGVPMPIPMDASAFPIQSISKAFDGGKPE